MSFTRQSIAGAPDREVIALYYPASRNGRRFALVSKILSAMEIHHAAVVPLLKRLGPGRLEKSAIQSPYCRVVSRVPLQTEIIIAETGQITQKLRNAVRKLITLSYDTKGFLASKAADDAFFHPILFHPDMVHEEAYQQARDLSRNDDRQIGVLFAGNCDEGTYTQNDMSAAFGILNRIEIGRLAAGMDERSAFIPEDREQFETALSNGELRNRLVWIDTNDFRIPQDQWLELISKSRFFICTPGVQYPYCQNLNEAAACGSVPLLQFPDVYFPALNDRMNCLSFDQAGDFATVVSKALKMQDRQWASLSQGAIDYHETHLSLNAIERRLEQFFLDPELSEISWILAGKAG